MNLLQEKVNKDRELNNTVKLCYLEPIGTVYKLPRYQSNQDIKGKLPKKNKWLGLKHKSLRHIQCI